MAPTFETLYDDAISPYLDGEMTADVALSDGTNVMKRFSSTKYKNNRPEYVFRYGWYFKL